MSVFNKITSYLDRNFYPFIITVMAHIVIAILFVVLHFSVVIERPYEVIMELDPEMLEEFLEEPEEESEMVETDVLAQGSDQMLSNQASNTGQSSGSSGGSSSGGGSQNNYGVSPDPVEEEQRIFDFQHDNPDNEITPYTSVFEEDTGDPYVGESTTKYKVGDGSRNAISEPKPHYLCPGGGLVYIDITVSKSGMVTKAIVNLEKSEVTSACLIDAAEAFAKDFVFTSGNDKESGYISFVMQSQ